MEMYPYIKSQEDLVSVVEAEYKLKTGKDLPSFFIAKMLTARRTTILRGMRNHQNIKLDRLGKLIITNSTKDCLAIRDQLGDTITHESFKKELHTRFIKGELHSQKYTKITGTPKAKAYGLLKVFAISQGCVSTDDDQIN